MTILTEWPPSKDKPLPRVLNWKPESELDYRERLLLAAEASEEAYSAIPFYAQRQKNNPLYWLDYAASAVNLRPKRWREMTPR